MSVNGDELPYIKQHKVVERKTKYDPDGVRFPHIEIVSLDPITLAPSRTIFYNEADAIKFAMPLYDYCNPSIIYVIEEKYETKAIPLSYLIYDRMISPLNEYGVRYEALKMPKKYVRSTTGSVL